MLQIKHLIDTPQQEMFVTRDDVLTLFAYLKVPDNLHVCECEDLVECVSRLAKDFDIPKGEEDIEDILDYEIIQGIEDVRVWDALEAKVY